MNTPNANRRLRPRVCAAVGLALGLLMVAVGAAAQSGAAGGTPEQVSVIYLELSQYGFQTDAVAIKPGKYLLIIRNCSTRKVVDFRLDRAGGAQVKAQRLDAQTPRYKEVLELVAGDYVLTAQHDKVQTVRLTVR